MATERRASGRSTGRGRLRRVLATLVALVAAGAVTTVVSSPAPARADVGAVLDFTGHGFGHGRGLGQWGSFGYATQHGWGHDQILRHYYGNTTLGSAPATTGLTVHLTGQDGRKLKVTSGQDFSVGGYFFRAGSAALVEARADGTLHLSGSWGCAQPDQWTQRIDDARVTTVAPAGDDLGRMVSICTSTGTKQYRGDLTTLYASGQQRTVNVLSVDDYLRGVVPRESPASWGDAAGGRGINALRAQAVAARSYALSESRSSWAKTCDTTSCQVYGGAATNGVSLEDPRTDRAVRDTAGQVLRDTAGRVVRAEFSASTGGYTAGGAFPAVADLGDSVSPHHDWSASLSSSEVGAALGVGTLQDFRITRRNGLGADGGRVLEVVVVGSAGSRTVSGSAVRSALGLRSDWFSLAPPRQVQPVLHVADANASGSGARAVPFGNSGDVPLLCDWDGDGRDSPGVFRGGWFSLSQSASGSGPYTTLAFGLPGDLPVCGDWDGDGRETVGVFRAGMVYLRNSTTSGPVDGSFAFGLPQDRPLAGDWNGDGFDTLGVYRNGWFHLTDSNLRPVTAQTVVYGNVGDSPVVGDWNGDGRDTVGVKRGAYFHLNEPGAVPSDLEVVFGLAPDRPLSGDLGGTGRDTVAVGRGY